VARYRCQIAEHYSPKGGVLRNSPVFDNVTYRITPPGANIPYFLTTGGPGYKEKPEKEALALAWQSAFRTIWFLIHGTQFYYKAKEPKLER
jgi:hypothetical protein